MECKEIVDLLNEYMDGELDEGERRIVDEHLKGCTGCRGQLAAIKSTVSMIEGLGELEVPAELSRALRQITQDAPGNATIKMPAQAQTAAKPATPKIARPAARRRGFALPKLQYLVATAAVATVALIVLLTQIDLGGLEKSAPVNNTARENAIPAGVQKSPDLKSESAGQDVNSQRIKEVWGI